MRSKWKPLIPVVKSDPGDYDLMFVVLLCFCFITFMLMLRNNPQAPFQWMTPIKIDPTLLTGGI